MVSNPTPLSSGYLPEYEGHQIYYADYGNPHGEAIINCHGGPGSKSKPSYANLFDLTKYHVIVFDQRGCGKSLPQGELKANDTAALISDMERLQSHFKLEKWYVAGSSWGSTLALLYAEANPSKVKGLLLDSIFLGRKTDVEWSFSKAGGIEKIFTDLWENRLEFLNKYETNPQDCAKILLAKFETGTLQEQQEITAGVINWEGNLMSAQHDLTHTNPVDVTLDQINEVKVFLHYDSHDSFIKENQILDEISKIKDIPAIIVHGRYDILCALDQMWILHKALKNSEAVILPTSNHKLTADGNIARIYAYRYFLEKVNN